MHAIQSHGDHTGVPRVTPMEKTLYAVDELCGFVTAVALVRPSKAVRDVDAGSVRKKMKDKAFARAVNREMMLKGAEDMAIPFEELTSEVIVALTDISDRLGLGRHGELIGPAPHDRRSRRARGDPERAAGPTDVRAHRVRTDALVARDLLRGEPARDQPEDLDLTVGQREAGSRAPAAGGGAIRTSRRMRRTRGAPVRGHPRSNERPRLAPPATRSARSLQRCGDPACG